jgi:aldose 1-epimerase
MTDPHSVVLEAGAARVELAPRVGGAVASFTLAGADVLRPTSAAARAAGSVVDHAAYPLVPYSNRIADASFVFAGRRHRLRVCPGARPHSLHGVGWLRPWSVRSRSATTATLLLEHAAIGEDALEWPFPFSATQDFVLAATPRAATLALTLTLANRGDEPFPCGLGWHPFFPRTPATRLRFAVGGRWENDASGLPARRTLPEPGGFAAGRSFDGMALDHGFFGWTGHAELTPPQSGVDVVLSAAPRCGHLIVYAPAGAGFLAIEPVTHATDAFNRAERGEADTGVAILQPHAEISWSMQICATLAA